MGSEDVTGLELVRSVFPGASEEDAEYMLWERTSFPFGPTVEHYRGQLERLKETLDAGHEPCDHCSEPAIGKATRWPTVPLCASCADGLGMTVTLDGATP